VFADARTKETLFQFWNEWFRLEKFTGFEVTRPGFRALVGSEPVGMMGHDYYADMVQEIRELTELFTFGDEKTLADLLTTDLSVTRSADLARLYGVTPWSGTGAYPTLPAGSRAGLLQRAALLVSNLEETNPFHRGALVRRNMLCDPLPQPDPTTLPPGALDPPPPSSAQTTRQRYQAKVEGNPTCAGCHNQFSDIGYVLESFDALGRARTVEKVFDEQTGRKLAELPLNTAGTIRIGAQAHSITNATELNQRIVESEKVEACLASKYFAFATRRPAESGSWDGCAVDEMTASLKNPSAGIAGAFMQIGRQASFGMRKVGPQ
jgi:hypothetical protein